MGRFRGGGRLPEDINHRGTEDTEKKKAERREESRLLCVPFSASVVPLWLVLPAVLN
jgi:hypothetical protein